MAPQAKEHDIEMGNVVVASKYARFPENDNGKGNGKNTTDRHTDGVISSSPEDEHNYNSLKYRFWVQVGITSAVSAFCIAMMAANSDREGMYLPVLTGIMGYWLPAPDSRVKRPAQK